MAADVASDIDTAADDGNGDRARTMARLLSHFDIMRRAEEQASELRIAEGRLLWLLTGDGPPRTVTEQDILDLEREAFLKLLGNEKTQERIQYTLKTGKPLRN